MGPLLVVQRVGPTAYKLDLSHSASLRQIHALFHISFLRDFRDNGLKYQPPPDKVEGQREDEIEAILGHRLLSSQPQFITSFIGHDASENIWLVDEQLSNARELMSEYQAAYQV